MSAVPCLSQSTLSMDGKWEGWCWYPDHPQDRAVVEVFVGSRSIRAVRAARLRTDVRDLGMGDGYCGFQLPLPSREYLADYSVLEVRERRFGRVIGRVVLGEDGERLGKERRLRTAQKALEDADAELSILSTQLRTQLPALEELGAILSCLSNTTERSIVSLQAGVVAACQDRVGIVPYADLGCSATPRVSLVVRADRPGFSMDVVSLASAIRRAAHVMEHGSAEIILLEDGTQPLARLLPSRLRHLAVVQTMPDMPPGVGLNAAASIARGEWLAFSGMPDSGAAQTMQLLRGDAEGTLYIESNAADPQVASTCHGLQSLVKRDAFYAMGGVDPHLDEQGIWADLLDRGVLTNQRIIRWKSVRYGALHPIDTLSYRND